MKVQEKQKREQIDNKETKKGSTEVKRLQKYNRKSSNRDRSTVRFKERSVSV